MSLLGKKFPGALCQRIANPEYRAPEAIVGGTLLTIFLSRPYCALRRQLPAECSVQQYLKRDPDERLRTCPANCHIRTAAEYKNDPRNPNAQAPGKAAH
ncbi:hypothetical protein N7535_000934 [Penicillium sp. DV-2018c]|nr:hypothetical protein N7535_000934 [Penicillium sp. DV-2018c]